MILRSGKEEVGAAIHQSVDRTLGARKKFFDHDFPTGLPEAASLDHIVDGCFGFAAVMRNNDSFPESQAIRFHCQRKSEFAQSGFRILTTIRIRRTALLEFRDEP